MTQTLSGLPQSLRANYARIQAHIRASYHTYLAARRKAEFQAHLSSTAPGGSLAPHSRARPTSSSARRERWERFERFVKTWCSPSIPGTKPFFESLWATMRLQVVPENLGGAGSRLIEWEFDDAAFMESAYVIKQKCLLTNRKLTRCLLKRKRIHARSCRRSQGSQ